MKYLEKYNDTYLANAPSEDVVRDWFVAEFEDNKYCDIDDIKVTRRAYNMRKGIRFYQYNVVLSQDFGKSSDITLASVKSLENFNDIVLNKMERKYGIIFNEHSIRFKSYGADKLSNVETTLNFYFRNVKNYHLAD